MYVMLSCRWLIRILNSHRRAFSAFPDSLQFDQGSQIHSFRIRGERIGVSSEKRPANADEFIYGYSYFTQKRDPSSKRGYEQVRHQVFVRYVQAQIVVALSRHIDISPLSRILFCCAVHFWPAVPRTRTTDARISLSQHCNMVR